MTPALMAWISGEAVKGGPEILLQAALVDVKDEVAEGHLVECAKFPWFAIVKEIDRDPHFLFQFAQHARRFEEFLAATYQQ